MLDWTDDDSQDSAAPLDLARDLGRGKLNHRGDLMGVADALDEAGMYDKSRFGNPPLADEHLFKAIERFQDDQGLDVDGLMKPGGPTVTRLNAVLGRRARSDDADAGPDAGPAAAPAPAADDGDGPRFVDLFRARRDAGAPEGFGPAFDIFEPDAPAPQLAQAQRPEPEPPARPRPREDAVVPPRGRYQDDRRAAPPQPSAPPEFPELPVPQNGTQPIGPRPGGAVGQLRPSFADQIAWAEQSDRGGGPRTGYGDVRDTDEGRMLGRYQLSPGLLTDIGMHGHGGDWTGALAQRFGILSERDFLNNPAAQDAAFEAFVRRAQTEIGTRGLDRFIGRSIDGIRGRIVITLPGLVAAIHRRGARAVETYLTELEQSRWASRSLPSRRNVRRRDRNDAIETRLRVFSYEPLSTD